MYDKCIALYMNYFEKPHLNLDNEWGWYVDRKNCDISLLDTPRIFIYKIKFSTKT